MKKINNLTRIRDCGVVAIIRGISDEKLINVVKALYEGGIDCIEVTFNTPGAKGMITEIKKTCGDKILVGAGTVLDEITAKTAIDAGAEFILSPSLNREVIEISNQYGVISIPGAYTPTEMVMAYTWGADIVKIFPAIGPEYIKALRGPLSHIPIMAVGGINLENAEQFIKAGSLCLGVGSALIPNKAIEENEFEHIKGLAKEFRKIIMLNRI